MLFFEFHSSLTNTKDDLDDVKWFRICVVERYGLQPSKNEIHFKKPQFKSCLRDPMPESFNVSAFNV